MEAPEFLIAVVGMLAGTTAFLFLVNGIFKLFHKAIDARSGNRLGDGVVSKAEFLETKARLERRIQTLEALVTDEETPKLRLPEDLEVDEDAPSVLRNKLKTR